jgi:hypothetical protein
MVSLGLCELSGSTFRNPFSDHRNSHLALPEIRFLKVARGLRNTSLLREHMSKKSRRQRRVNLPPEAFNAPIAAAPAVSTAQGAATAAPVQRRTTEINWKQEYSSVLGDLKRTGILAAIMMGAMIALSFVIR